MFNYAKIEDEKVTGVYQFEEIFSLDGMGTFVDVTSLPEVQVGWGYDAENDTFTENEQVSPLRKSLTRAEWINTFTPDEWEETQNGSHIPGFVINGTEVTKEIRQQWRIDIDMILSEETVVLDSKEVTEYYAFLVENGYITIERKGELLEGIE